MMIQITGCEEDCNLYSLNFIHFRMLAEVMLQTFEVRDHHGHRNQVWPLYVQLSNEMVSTCHYILCSLKSYSAILLLRVKP